MTQTTHPPTNNNDDTEVWTPKALKPLTRKQQAFTNYLIENPKASGTEAAKATYGKEGKPVTELSARAIASENLTKPNIVLELAKHSSKAELVILEVLEQSRKKMYEDERNGDKWAVNARQTADSLLDRVHGKAKQTVDVTTKAVVINIDLTGVTDATP